MKKANSETKNIKGKVDKLQKIWLGRWFLKITSEDSEPEADFDVVAIRQLLDEAEVNDDGRERSTC